MPAHITDTNEQLMEKLSAFFSVENHLPPSIARVFAFLLICQPTAQNTQQIGHALKMSTGSLSNAVNFLQNLGFIRKALIPGERRHYYEIDPEGLRNAVRLKLRSIKLGVEITQEGLHLSGNDPRMQALFDMYKIFDNVTTRILRELDAPQP